jgi:putative endopeptidase
MNKLLGELVGACLCMSTISSAQTPSALGSGIDMQFMDRSVRPQDDFYTYVNGKWMASVQIPSDRARWGTFDILAEQGLDQLHGILEGLQTSLDEHDPDQPKIANLYASFTDEAAVGRLGLKPLRGEFARIDAIRSKRSIPALIAHMNRIGVTAPYTPRIHQDAKDSNRNVFDIGQDALGMPDRDYYLLEDARLRKAREQYLAHMQKMLQMAGYHRTAQDARDILDLETRLAKVQWTRVENRNPVKVYNKIAIKELDSLSPGYDWKTYLADAGVPGSIDYVIVRQPSYIAAFNEILASTPLPVWKAYFRWHLLSDYSPYLSDKFADEHFAFYGTALRGIEQNEVRWKRGVHMVENSMGEGLGKIYVAKYFSPDAKARVEQIVKNLLAAYQTDVHTLDWMSPETRQKADEKLTKFTYKIAYPIKWRDYSTLRIVKGDLVGNVMRANVFEYERNLHKLGQPVDRTEWRMTPQTVNAYYNPERNEIVFPAAILRPPYFDPAAEDAVNYGGIGAVIGHEISHGFDDQGSQYDGDGDLLDAPGWFTQADLEHFKARTHALVEQYAAYSPVPGYHLNGELTLGENIADNSGIAIAYKAYKISLGGNPGPVIDGLTGAQRFYMGWAQVWRGKTRENELINRIKTDPHSPSDIRGTVPERNQASFYEAFDIKPGDKMYLPPDQRVTLW